MNTVISRLLNKFAQSIQLRLTSYFLIILVPLVAISLFANFRSQSILEKQVNERTFSAMRSAMGYIDLTLKNVEKLSVLISTDDNLNQQLAHEDTELSFQTILDFQKVLIHISNVNSINTMMSQISVFHARSKLMISSLFGGKRTEGLENEDWYRKTMEKDGKSVWLIPDKNEYTISEELDPIFNTKSITMLRLMDPYNRNGAGNVLMMTISKEKLLYYIRNLTNSSDEQIYLFDDEGRLVASTPSDPAFVPHWNDETKDMQYGVSPEGNERTELIRVKSPDTGWSLVLVQPMKTIYAQTDNLRIFTYVIIGVSILLATLISWVVYRGIASPLTTLAYGMKQLRLGNLNARLPGGRRDEFGFLLHSFNEMAREQKHLIENIYEQQMLRMKTEMKFLQSQINPHFLYNTLDSIYWRAKNYDADEISEMVLNLSKFFRLSLSKGKEVFTVQETVEHLHSYLRVQQLRFMDHFTVRFDVQEECKDVPVLKLLLQPLVENAILHGLEKKPEGGELAITCGIEEELLKLEVKDNGKGMTAQRLQFIREQLNKLSSGNIVTLPQDQQFRDDLFGLWNVKSRLKLYYGDRAELTVESVPDAGTTVTIYIPLDKCFEDMGGDNRESHDR